MQLVNYDVLISSTFKCTMNLNLNCRAGLSFLMIPSTSLFIESPTNMYFMWYLCEENRVLLSDKLNWKRHNTHNRSQIGSMWFRWCWALSICSSSSYKIIVMSMTVRGMSELRRCKNGPAKWHRNKNWISFLMTGANFSLINLKIQ